MAEFSKAGQKMERAKRERELGAEQLLEKFKADSGLRQHLEHAKRIIAARGDPDRTSRKSDDMDLDGLVKAIQIEVCDLTASNAGVKINRKDVEEFIAKRLHPEV